MRHHRPRQERKRQHSARQVDNGKHLDDEKTAEVSPLYIIESPVPPETTLALRRQLTPRCVYLCRALARKMNRKKRVNARACIARMNTVSSRTRGRIINLLAYQVAGLRRCASLQERVNRTRVRVSVYSASYVFQVYVLRIYVPIYLYNETYLSLWRLERTPFDQRAMVQRVHVHTRANSARPCAGTRRCPSSSP